MNIDSRSVLVVGGAGYVGGTAVDILLEYGWDVTVFEFCDKQ